MNAREKRSQQPLAEEKDPGRPGFGDKVTVAVLAAMVAVLATLRFHILERAAEPETLAFEFRNPMLDAEAGERVLFYDRARPDRESCFVVRHEGVVLRPAQGPERVGTVAGLTRALPYLACDSHARVREQGCGGADRPSQVVLFALNYFGMPHDTQVRVDSLQPLRMRWGDREITVFEIVMQRYGGLSGTWTTYLSEDAPVAGLVKRKSLRGPGMKVEHNYREILGP